MSDKKPHIKPLDSAPKTNNTQGDVYDHLNQLPYPQKIAHIQSLERALKDPKISNNPTTKATFEDLLSRLKASCPIRPINEDHEK